MTPKRRRLRVVLIAGAITVSLTVLGWFLGPSGTVYGIEFSPDRFSHRSFRYYQWCGIQITPRQTHEWRSEVDDYIHEYGFASSVDVPQPRWHFVKGFAPGVRGWHGNAKYMCQSVGCWGGNDEWVKWSTDHPDLASIIWPQVVEWARNEQYYEIMTLFRFTELENAASPEDVQGKIEFAKVHAQG